MLTWIRWPASNAADRGARGTSRLRNIELSAAWIAPAPARHRKDARELQSRPRNPALAGPGGVLHPSPAGLTEVSAHCVPSCHLGPQRRGPLLDRRAGEAYEQPHLHRRPCGDRHFHPGLLRPALRWRPCGGCFAPVRVIAAAISPRRVGAAPNIPPLSGPNVSAGTIRCSVRYKEMHHERSRKGCGNGR